MSKSNIDMAVLLANCAASMMHTYIAMDAFREEFTHDYGSHDEILSPYIDSFVEMTYESDPEIMRNTCKKFNWRYSLVQFTKTVLRMYDSNEQFKKQFDRISEHNAELNKDLPDMNITVIILMQYANEYLSIKP